MGVGSSLAARLKRLTGPRLIDMVCHLPRGVEMWRAIQFLHQAKPDERISIVVTVLEHIEPSSRKSFYKVVCSDDKSLIDLVFFKAYPATLLKQYPYGEKRLICGIIERNEFGQKMVHPIYVGPPAHLKEWSGPIPVYPLTAGISGKFFHRMIKQILQKIPDGEDWIPSSLLGEKKWPTFQQALERVHNPQKESDLTFYCKARQRLSFDELLAHQLSLGLIKQERQKRAAPILGALQALDEGLFENLPFQLTKGQKKVLKEIYEDLESGQQMHRLLQGDVGSGKTVIALFTLLRAVANGYQGALLVPTEILASQHLITFQRFLKNLPITVELFTADSLSKNRKEKMERLQKGEIQIVIGTHALIEKAVNFKNLGTIIIDEQHRFGVEQRLKLSRKGEYPHTLIMTATPIPRSLAWTEYGDLSLSLLTEKPAHRKPIQTSVMPLKKIDQVYDGLKRVVEKNEKIFWVCPLIEESEKLDLGAAESRYESIKEHFPGKVGFIHGRMDAPTRDKILKDFRQGDLQILVSTTVIEVGLHVGEATVMVIENAERFGLSQLHQLRGRVGRGDKTSACLLLYGYAVGDVGRQRLSIIKSTEDGFRIAEEDLKLRGSGDLLGTKQSGLPTFRIADLALQADLLELAHDTAQDILSKDPKLQSRQGGALRVLLALFGYKL